MQDILKRFQLSLIKGSLVMEDIPDSEYFSPKYKDYVSNSKLALLNPAQNGSPTKFLQGFKSNNSPALALGSAVHQMLLQPNDFYMSNISAPTGKLLIACHCFKEYRDEGKSIEESIVLACNKADYFVSRMLGFTGQLTPGFVRDGIFKCLKYYKTLSNPPYKDGKEPIILSDNMRDTALNCINNVKGNKCIMSHLGRKDSLCEMAILASFSVKFPKDFSDPNSEMVEEVVKFKMKLDHGWIDHETRTFCLNDVKTSGKPVERFMGYEEYDPMTKTVNKHSGSWETFHYARQMAIYYYLLKEYIRQEFGDGYIGTANMLVVETIGLNHAMLYNVSNEQMKIGWLEGLELLKRVAYHQRNGYENALEIETNRENGYLYGL